MSRGAGRWLSDGLGSHFHIPHRTQRQTPKYRQKRTEQPIAAELSGQVGLLG